MGILTKFVEYKRINWKNGKAGKTQTGASNFNIMDAGIKANNEAIAELNDVKLDNTDERIQKWDKSMPLGDVWLPENGISIDALDNGSYSTNPSFIPAIGLPDELNVYGTLFINKTPAYNTITYHDVLGGFAVYNTHEGKWCVVAKKSEIPTKLAELQGDGTHRTVTDEQITKWNNGADIPLATTTKDGLMSATDKQKLDNIGEIEFEKTTIFSGINFLSEEVPMDRFLGYDFIYIETGGTPLTTSNDVFRYNADKSYLIPGMVFDEFEQYYQSGRYILHDSDNDNIFLQYNKILSNPSYVLISHASADKWFGIWGIKIKGETASNVGGKVLKIETDTTASTYQISGNADTTPLILETVAYGSDGSVKAIASNYCYVNGSDVKNLPMTTSLSNTYGVVTTHSSGVIQVSNKEGYKLKVWITGSGYNVTKQ